MPEVPRKICARCGIEHPARITPSRPWGQPYCAPCHRLMNLRWKTDRRDYFIAERKRVVREYLDA